MLGMMGSVDAAEGWLTPVALHRGFAGVLESDQVVVFLKRQIPGIHS